MKKLLLALLSLVLLAGCQTSNNNSNSETTNKTLDTITVAFLPNEGSGSISTVDQMLIDELQKALGDDIKINGIVCDDYSAVTEAMLTGTAQIAWESGATFVATKMEDDAIIPLVTYGVDGDVKQASYPAFIATNKENEKDFEGKSKEEQYEQLVDKSFSFVSATSTSGRLVPTTTLFMAFGPDGNGKVENKSQVFEKTTSDGGLFSEVQFGGNHPGSVQLIVENKVYAGAFCCKYGDDFMDQLYIIDEVDVPNGPLWVNSDYINADMQEAIINHFVAMTPENSVENFFSNEDGFFFESDGAGANRFVKIPDGFYDFLYEMYKD
ncbi:MAG: PhnD/SsuA/transferrin family substrate-binding protein [Longicatena sp.]|uniref:phosphate/phosphite/phosphonate ABC transporter substrate-binding protein n=1 Tax=Anaerorhabdus sp. TaxID=1872524 RepID=UPI002FCA5C8C